MLAEWQKCGNWRIQYLWPSCAFLEITVAAHLVPINVKFFFLRVFRPLMPGNIIQHEIFWCINKIWITKWSTFGWLPFSGQLSVARCFWLLRPHLLWMSLSEGRKPLFIHFIYLPLGCNAICQGITRKSWHLPAFHFLLPHDWFSPSSISRSHFQAASVPHNLS